ncbi:MAG: hypothetical protein JNJ49_11260, partial [Bdellovibrionaceae bacterium]|nr:hypothetical protein [Pseudobdellovibrionaceae bacterium]
MIKAVYDLIQSGTYGKAIGYSLYCGSYLPDWRPGRDYRSLYSSSARLGGGVHIDLIHEFDFASYWFGPYQSISGRLAKVSRLEIDSIDDCASLTKHSGGVIGTVHLDYYRPVARREFEVVFPEVVVRGDLLTSKIEIASKAGSELKDYSITREALFDRQAKAVLAAIRANEKSPWSLAECSDTNRRVLRQGTNFGKNSEE